MYESVQEHEGGIFSLVSMMRRFPCMHAPAAIHYYFFNGSEPNPLFESLRHLKGMLIFCLFPL